jgi:peroxiredoxin
MSTVLWAAAAYNLVWGASVLLFPRLWLDWLRLPEGANVPLWRCIGMIVGVYGAGYAIAAANPLRHWPIVLVGLLGKLLGPPGFLAAARAGELPWRFGWINVVNDLIWWVPFALILRNAYHAWAGEEAIRAPEQMAAALEQCRTQHGESLAGLSEHARLMVVFLRHVGCTFCRESLSDLAAQRSRLEREGSRIVLVHMSDDARAERFFRRYGLADLDRISDPAKRLYRVFGLKRGGLRQLFGFKVVWRGLVAGILRGHGAGRLEGDGFQMPGVFVLEAGHVRRSFRHRSAADRPDYLALGARTGPCGPAAQ